MKLLKWSFAGSWRVVSHIYTFASGCSRGITGRKWRQLLNYLSLRPGLRQLAMLQRAAAR